MKLNGFFFFRYLPSRKVFEFRFDSKLGKKTGTLFILINRLFHIIWFIIQYSAGLFYDKYR